jgi:hypothetical protein
MAKYGSNSIIIEFEKADSVGSADTNITPYITKMGDVAVNKGAVESTPFGVSFPEYLSGVLKDYGEITLEGFYDDTATSGPNAIFNSTNIVARYWKITYGGGKYSAGRCWITGYTRGAEVGGYVTFTATIRTTGTVTEA